MYKYLIIKCDELGDQWECDANRTPICLTNDYDKYNTMGYEIYKIKENGTFELIRNYDDVTNEYMCVYWWNDEDKVEEQSPDKIIKIQKGDRDNVTKSLIKKIKQQYHFTDTIKEIERNIYCSGYHSELIDNKWTVFGETFDNWFPYGY